MRILLIDAIHSFVDFALRCEAAGHEVKVFMGPDPKGLRHPAGDGLVTKVSSWQPHMKWADLICLSDNTKYIRELEGYRREGYPIWGCNTECASWELQRDVGVEVLEAAGIPTIPSILFRNYDEAILHLQANPDKRYVSKPLGDADRSLSYVSKSSRDLMFMLGNWKKNAPRHPFIFQEFHGGIEMAVGAWVGPNGFLGHCLENFEFKKLMPGEIGPNCYSEDTEVLTRGGWKLFRDVTLEDEFSSYDPKTGKSFFEKATKLHWAHYKGPMYSFQNRYLDLLVTPSHNMYAARRKTEDWRFVEAQTCPSEFDVKQVGKSQEPDVGEFILPDGTRIDGDAWMRFLGVYLSEGYTSADRPRVVVCQNPGPKQDLMYEALLAMKLPWYINDNKMMLTHAGLAEYSRQFGLSAQKFVPKEVMGASARQINLFLEAFNLGDGDDHGGHRRYCSGSYRLISDLQALMYLTGKTGVISTDTRTSMVSPLNGKTYAAQPVYSVEESSREKVSVRGREIVPYDGMIGCVTVPSTHLLAVRRNGRVALCGNTGEMGTAMKYVPLAESVLAQKMLLPIEAALIRSGYTGYIDVAVIIDKKGNVWPLEFTTRPGWPLFQIQQVLHPDPAQWMVDCLNGRDTFDPYLDIALGIVVAIKDFPYNFQPREVMCGFPVWGVTEKNRYHVHPCELMLGEAPELVGGKLKPTPMMVTAGSYAMVVSGVGDTVCEAQECAYGNLAGLELANSPMYRDDIGDRLKKQLPELQKLGFATSWKVE